MICSVAPVSAPLKARNGEPGSTLIATGAPVIAACVAGSVYIAKRLSAGAGRTTDWEMMVRMGRSPRLQNPVSARHRDNGRLMPLGDYIAPICSVSLKLVEADVDRENDPHHRQATRSALRK